MPQKTPREALDALITATDPDTAGTIPELAAARETYEAIGNDTRIGRELGNLIRAAEAWLADDSGNGRATTMAMTNARKRALTALGNEEPRPRVAAVTLEFNASDLISTIHALRSAKASPAEEGILAALADNIKQQAERQLTGGA